MRPAPLLHPRFIKEIKEARHPVLGKRERVSLFHSNATFLIINSMLFSGKEFNDGLKSRDVLYMDNTQGTHVYFFFSQYRGQLKKRNKKTQSYLNTCAGVLIPHS